MFIKSLRIHNGRGEVLRKIMFQYGLNLIVDETDVEVSTKTGNNVGKTTVLRLVDFCLGGSARSIWVDPESKKEEYKLVKNYLMDNNVVIKLELVEDLDNPNASRILIERNFLNYKQKIQRINGVNYSNEEFENKLSYMLYGVQVGDRPTYRQLMAHNIRISDIAISQTIKHLDNYTSNVEYEALYLFMLGCDVSNTDVKQELLAKIKIEEGYKRKMEENNTRSGYESMLAIVEHEIEKLTSIKDGIYVNPNYSKYVELLQEVRYEKNVIASDLSRTDVRKRIIEEALEEMENDKADIDIEQLRVLYEQASELIGNAQKTFEELCVYHDKMLEVKKKFIGSEMPSIKEEIKEKNRLMRELDQKESKYEAELRRSNTHEELERIIGKINEQYRLKGEYETLVRSISATEDKISEYKEELEEIDNVLFSDEYEMIVKNRVKLFNRYFSEVSEILYGEKYALKYDIKVKDEKKTYLFSAFNTNLSSGKKQGEISCFDIAYTLYADEQEIPCMHFLLNDKKELMHANQLIKLAELVKEKKLQYVASILNDKLPIKLSTEDNIVLRLSQDSKLFKIESNSRLQ